MIRYGQMLHQNRNRLWVALGRIDEIPDRVDPQPCVRYILQDRCLFGAEGLLRQAPLAFPFPLTRDPLGVVPQFFHKLIRRHGAIKLPFCHVINLELLNGRVCRSGTI